MDKSDYLLMLLREPTTFSQINKEFSWTNSTTINILHRLIERKLIIKIDTGLYQTSKQGIEFLLEKMKTSEIKKRESLDDKLLYISFILIKKKRDENSPLMPKEIIGLADIGIAFTEIKKIYNNSVLGEDHTNMDFIREMWSIHKEKKCNLHGFDFDRSYKENVSHLQHFTNPDDLFKQLHSISLPLLEQFKLKFYPHILKKS